MKIDEKIKRIEEARDDLSLHKMLSEIVNGKTGLRESMSHFWDEISPLISREVKRLALEELNELEADLNSLFREINND